MVRVLPIPRLRWLSAFVPCCLSLSCSDNWLNKSSCERGACAYCKPCYATQNSNGTCGCLADDSCGILDYCNYCSMCEYCKIDRPDRGHCGYWNHTKCGLATTCSNCYPCFMDRVPTGRCGIFDFIPTCKYCVSCSYCFEPSVQLAVESSTTPELMSTSVSSAREENATHTVTVEEQREGNHAPFPFGWQRFPLWSLALLSTICCCCLAAVVSFKCGQLYGRHQALEEVLLPKSRDSEVTGIAMVGVPAADATDGTMETELPL
eukprot:TRINITY_DN61593_c0_g1_i1.p1 TRINITY_DN61593_c0_g1~~TRINITY_DN61593_c0_g1_i1.p1  ORF type:complete len:278 (-),score=7.73 TRINITY_DN61593_c0_g1_i1:78-866(-)